MTDLHSILAVMAVSSAPITELRAGIPLAIHTFRFSPFSAVLFSVIGNMVPGILIVAFLDRIMLFLARRIPALHDPILVRLAKMRDKVRPQIEKYGVVGLAVFIGIPLPMTGIWTGAVGAVLLGLPRKKAILACLGGVMIAATVIMLIDLGVVSFLKFLL
jgi:uncharacterized membrane protein